MPLYDDIIDAYELSPSGGSVVVDTVGATLETNEIDINCAVGFSNWLQIDLSSLVGIGEGRSTNITAATISGAVLPSAYVLFDPTGTFDPSAPDFDVLNTVAYSFSTIGDGTGSPPAVPITFIPDTDGNPSGLYWISVGDWNCADTGEIQFDWDAFVEADCGDQPTIGTVTVVQTFAGGALVEAEVCAGAYDCDVRAQYGPTTGYGLGSTSNVTIPAAHAFTTVQILVYDCGGFDMSPATLYHFRIVADTQGPGVNVNGSDHTFTTDSLSAPANNDIANAVDLGSAASGSVDGDNSGADLEAGETDLLYEVDNGIYACTGSDIGYGGGRSVHHKWTAPADMDIAFYTGSVEGRFGGDGQVGLCDTIITVLDGDDFATANVIVQNEYDSIGYNPGSDSYAWSLAQFSAESGHTYWIVVDGYNGDKPSDGGYDIDNTYQGPFRLYWGPAVVDFPVLCPTAVCVDSDENSISVEVDVIANGPNGASVWVTATDSGFVTQGSSPSADTVKHFGRETATVTVTGLPSNAAYHLTVHASDGTHLHGAEALDSLVVPGLCYTHLPVQFDVCPPDESIDFTGDDCTAPDGLTLSDGFRIQDNALAAYEWQEYNEATGSGSIALGSGMTPGLGISIKLSEVAAKQDIGFDVSNGFKYFARSDGGTIQLVQYEVATLTETVLDTDSTVSDGDSLGCRLSVLTGDLEAWVGEPWNQVLLVNLGDLTSETGTTFFAQSAPAGPPAIDDSMCYDISLLGTIPLGGTCHGDPNKYSWSYFAFHNWSGPYFGGSLDNDYPNPGVDCPSWWLDLKVKALGKIDCDLESIGGSGNDGFEQSWLAGLGVSAALVPFYPDLGDYDSELDDYESNSFGGFLTWDGDFAHKGGSAVLATLDSVQAAFAGDGAVKITNMGDGGRNSYGVFMPVKVAPGRIDDFKVWTGRCGGFVPQIIRYK